ncbi:hypothetical protein D9613_009582 [Agrocybe pediades]|uniref:S-adenosyl-L-methionine-dependent methyltransferase n=1 Tax=Agrocybe pediades TaxID=84607 RepID=A0A8H4R2A1_9AGAR|nr:hypothetical protein D9613_009582 [Agrocybe pediades]
MRYQSHTHSGPHCRRRPAMKLLNALSFLIDLRMAITVAVWPTFKAVFARPILLLKPQEVSRIFMSHVWTSFADGVDEGGSAVKKNLITPNAYGVVLDVGAGKNHLICSEWLGHTVPYLNRARITKYVALEPNVLMHSALRVQANKAGYHESDGTLTILASGVEDVQSILSTLSSFQPVDTIITILTLCSIPEPEKNITRMVHDVLKPEGQLLMYEHVLSKREDVAWWQRLWAPIWACAFDGCRMDRASDDIVARIREPGGKESIWQTAETWGKEGEDQENLFWHAAGRFVKK